MIAFFRLIRIANLFIVALSLSLFYYLVLVPVHFDKLYTTLLPFTGFEFIIFVLSIILVASAGNVINDYFDFEADKEFQPSRPLAKGAFTLDQVTYLHAIFLFSGIGLGFYIGWSCNNLKIGYLYIIAALLMYVYSSYLKKIPLIGNLVIAALYAFPFVLLMMFESQFLSVINFENGNLAFAVLLLQMKYYGGFTFLLCLAREIVKDIESAEADAVFNFNTVAVQFGENISKIIATGVLFILLGALIFLMKGFYEAKAFPDLSYLLIVVAVPVFICIVLLFLAKEKRNYSRISWLLKLIWLLGILSIPAFYLFNK